MMSYLHNYFGSNEEVDGLKEYLINRGFPDFIVSLLSMLMESEERSTDKLWLFIQDKLNIVPPNRDFECQMHSKNLEILREKIINLEEENARLADELKVLKAKYPDLQNSDK